MIILKCQALLDCLHQKKYHYFKDDDIIRHVYNMDDEEWNALSCSTDLLEFYLDYPNSGVPYDKELLDGDRMMEYYDNLFYHVAKNRSRMLTLSPSLAEMMYEDITGKDSDEIEYCKHPFVWIIGVLYIAWVILLFSVPGSQPFWQSALIAVFGGPEFILGLVFLFCIIQFVVVGLYNMFFVAICLFYIRQHRKSEYGKLSKKQAKYRAARLAASKNT